MRRLVAAASAIAVLAASACRKGTEPPVARTASLADSAEQVLYAVHSVLTNKGIQRGDMTADTAFVFDDQTRFVFRNVHVNFTKDTGEPNGTMRADSGQYNMRTQVLEGWGNVIITTTDGRRLTTPQLRYNQAANLVSSDTSFVLTDKDRVQTGIGFNSDPNLNRVQVMRAAKGSGVITSFPDH